MQNLRTLLALAFLAVSIKPAVAGEHLFDEIIVTERQTKRVIYLEDQLDISPDTSQLLKKVPGANVNGNGPLSGIPQYRGMFGARIGFVINGALLAPAGPNWMDPPLSYVAPAQLVKLEVYRGIAPVSVPQETIGGAIISETVSADFTNTKEFTSSGILTTSAQSVNDGFLLSGSTSFANNSHHVSIAAMSEEGDDARFSGGRILPSSYERERGEVSYGFRSANHTFSINYTRNTTGEAGTPTLAMDIDYFSGDLFNARYQYEGQGWSLDARLFGSELHHGMTNYHLRPTPIDKTLWRQNTTSAENEGFVISGTHQDDFGEWQIGFDYFSTVNNSLIDNPNNTMFFVEGFNNATRSVSGVFAEHQHRFSGKFQLEIGARINYVKMSADAVDGTPARMMPPAMALRDQFNEADRDSSDTNLDMVAKLWHRTSDTLSLYAGIAQKTRSPSFQERFLWLPLQATGGLADGFTYTGNLDLEAEESGDIELGFDLIYSRFNISPRLFYREVRDFIQGTPTENQAALMFVNMMNLRNRTDNPNPLRFNNVDAEFYGLDIDWKYTLNENWSFSGLMNYVRGKRSDVDDNLYRVAPANMTFVVDYEQENWNLNAELVAYASQNHVSLINSEETTTGYELMNISGSYLVTENLRLSMGVDNVLDETYQDHLTGYNRARNPDIVVGGRLYGYGRNVFLKANYKW